MTSEHCSRPRRVAARCAAQIDSPAGLWKTIDDETKKEKSLVRIVESGGV